MDSKLLLLEWSCHLNTGQSEGCCTEPFTAGREKTATAEGTVDHRVDKRREKTADSKHQVISTLWRCVSRRNKLTY